MTTTTDISDEATRFQALVLIDDSVGAHMPIQTDFLPAERLTQPEIVDQARQVRESPVLMAMLDTSPGMIALLDGRQLELPANDN